MLRQPAADAALVKRGRMIMERHLGAARMKTILRGLGAAIAGARSRGDSRTECEHLCAKFNAYMQAYVLDDTGTQRGLAAMTAAGAARVRDTDAELRRLRSVLAKNAVAPQCEDAELDVDKWDAHIRQTETQWARLEAGADEPELFALGEQM